MGEGSGVFDSVCNCAGGCLFVGGLGVHRGWAAIDTDAGIDASVASCGLEALERDGGQTCGDESCKASSRDWLGRVHVVPRGRSPSYVIKNALCEMLVLHLAFSYLYEPHI